MNFIDKRLEKLGFKKIEEIKYGVSYERHCEEFNYVHCLDIMHKSSGNHIILSYKKGINADGFNNVVGLNYQEIKLILKKYKQMKRKYKWK